MNSTAVERQELSGLRVLVVDDEEDSRDIVAAMLTHEGAEVGTAPSAQEGFELLTRFLPHVLVSDIGMPVEDGYSFVARVRQLPAEAGGKTPSIALTAYTSAEDRRRALGAGFNVHLGKPINLERLIAVIVELSQRTSVLEQR
ncbi:MAG: response regulator [Pseudomonadota bacterium]